MSTTEEMSGVELIAAERRRQVEEEGWTAEHDEEHIDGELCGGAAAYATVAHRQIGSGQFYAESVKPPAQTWRWSHEWWKPSEDPIRNLVKAGALIAAEIDRLQRRAATMSDETGQPQHSHAPAGFVCGTCHPELLPVDFDPAELLRLADEARDRRAADMPDTASALAALHRAWLRLKELGWREQIYAPADGTRFLAIEAGSTGQHTCYRDEERCFWIDDGDVWPSKPILWRPIDAPSTEDSDNA